jgi:hypothetical protein
MSFFHSANASLALLTDSFICFSSIISYSLISSSVAGFIVSILLFDWGWLSLPLVVRVHYTSSHDFSIF